VFVDQGLDVVVRGSDRLLHPEDLDDRTDREGERKGEESAEEAEHGCEEEEREEGDEGMELGRAGHDDGTDQVALDLLDHQDGDDDPDDEAGVVEESHEDRRKPADPGSYDGDDLDEPDPGAEEERVRGADQPERERAQRADEDHGDDGAAEPTDESFGHAGHHAAGCGPPLSRDGTEHRVEELLVRFGDDEERAEDHEDGDADDLEDTERLGQQSHPGSYRIAYDRLDGIADEVDLHPRLFLEPLLPPLDGRLDPGKVFGQAAELRKHGLEDEPDEGSHDAEDGGGYDRGGDSPIHRDPNDDRVEGHGDDHPHEGDQEHPGDRIEVAEEYGEEEEERDGTVDPVSEQSRQPIGEVLGAGERRLGYLTGIDRPDRLISIRHASSDPACGRVRDPDVRSGPARRTDARYDASSDPAISDGGRGRSLEGGVQRGGNRRRSGGIRYVKGEPAGSEEWTTISS
jgi:hypothetical protein